MADTVYIFLINNTALEIVGHKSSPLGSSKDEVPLDRLLFQRKFHQFERYISEAWRLIPIQPSQTLLRKREPAQVKYCPQDRCCIAFSLTVSPERYASYSHYMDRKLRPRKSNISRAAQPGVRLSLGLSVWGGTLSVSHLTVHVGVPLAPRVPLSLKALVSLVFLNSRRSCGHSGGPPECKDFLQMQ